MLKYFIISILQHKGTALAASIKEVWVYANSFYR